MSHKEFSRATAGAERHATKPLADRRAGVGKCGEARAFYRLADWLFAEAPPLTRWKQRLRCLTTPFGDMLAVAPHGANILEVGCGCGLFLGLAAACGLRVRGLGIDSSEAAIRTATLMARRVGAETDSELRFERRCAQEPLPDGEFDLVALIDVVHHLPPAAQEDAVRRAAARVRRGGTFLYKDMCERPSWRAWANRLHDLLSYQQWIHYAPIDGVDRWVRDEGLERTQAQRVNLFCYGHDLRVFRRPA